MSYRKQLAIGAVATLGFVTAACGGDSAPSSGEFVGRVDEICRTLGNDLDDLVQPTDLAGLSGFASDASKAFENSLADLKALKVPGDDAVVADAKQLVSTLDDQISTLDDMASAATAGDQATVDQHIATFTAAETDLAGTADDLGAGRCALDPLFAFEVAPPVTEPPVTEPPVTEPPVTEPPITEPPAASGNKTIEPFAVDMTAVPGFTFVDADQSIVETFLGIIETAPSVAAAPGMVAGIDVVDATGVTTTRIFVFLPESPLPASTGDELVPIVANGATTTPGAYGFASGATYTDGDKFYFIGADDETAPNIVVWAVSVDSTTMEAAMSAFQTSLAS